MPGTIDGRQPCLTGFAAFTLAAILATTIADAQTLDAVSPPAQRVHEYIELTGSGFGTSQGTGLVRFSNGGGIWNAGRAYVWRDDYIRIRVPVGKLDAGVAVPISKAPLSVFVETASGTTESLAFQVTAATGGRVSFRELTSVQADHSETSDVLGSPSLNAARTKDAEVADVNGDGWPDLQDNNSNNILNNTHSVLRLNEQDKSFAAIALEPNVAGEAGTFATDIAAGGDFFDDHTSYDADYADINNDRLPDLLQTAADRTGIRPIDHRVRILMNNRGNVPGQFTEESAARLPAGAFGDIGCPDDLDHVDMNGDGDVDFLISMRTAVCNGDTSEVRIFRNDGRGVFSPPMVVTSRAGNSTHDVFWFDANGDGLYDFIAANEFDNVPTDGIDVRSQLFLNLGLGGFIENTTLDIEATAGDVGDFNGDGLMDFVLGRTGARIFLTRADSPCRTNPASACTYDPVQIAPSVGNNPLYDLEVGDLDLDGDLDIVGVRILPNAQNVAVWINPGTSTSFTDITGGTAASVLPGSRDYQRLSADLLDFDLDGDLDLYVTGQDREDIAFGGTEFGRGPNQFFENLTVGLDILSPRQGMSAYAGTAAGGRKVLVRLRATVPVAGALPDDFAIEVDGAALLPSATVTGARIEGEYWLLVQMPAKPDGCYPLRIILIPDPALEDTEPNALCYETDRSFDRVLAIDRTGSMLYNSATDAASPEKMDAARAAANFFVNLSEDADEIGIVSFKRDSDDGDGLVAQDELARTDFGMKPAVEGSTDNRTLAVGVIGGIRPDGTDFPLETSIGAGLQQAWNDVQGEGDAGHEWEIVLLSDGLENYPPFWERVHADPPMVPPLRPEIVGASPPVTVHTVAIGEDADAPLLMDIADQTGGLFFGLYEGTASFGLTSRLSAVYKYIDEEIRDEQRFFYREGVPTPVVVSGGRATDRSTVRVDSLFVPNGFESVTVGFHWNENDAVEVVLTDPDSVPIAPAPPVTTIHSNPKHKVYRIRNPRVGWHYYAVVVRTRNPFEFFAVASGITDLIAEGRKGTLREALPGMYEIPLRVVIGDFEPVLHANVSGDVILPDKSRVPIRLLDDGVHEDGRSLDGIYGRVFAHTMPGGYMVDLTVTGVSNRHEPFTRHILMSFAVPGLTPDPDHPEVPPGQDRPGDGLDQGPALSVHVGSSHPLGVLNEGADANIHVRLDASYPLRTTWRAQLLLGFSQFTEDRSTGRDNLWYSHASANLQANISTATGPVWYLQSGPGVYRPKTGGAAAGANVGFGGRIPFSSGPFAAEFGVDYHYVFADRRTQFLTTQLGVVWRP